MLKMLSSRDSAEMAASRKQELDIPRSVAKRQTASVYLKKLCDVGVLEEVKAGREKLFINSRLMRLLTAEDPGDLSFAQ